MNNHRRLVVVDDEESGLEILVALLTRHGFEVASATEGRAGLALIEEERPELVLLDVRMPGMDGYEVCRRLKHNHETRDIPVIFLSAHGHLEEKIQGFEVGGVDYVSKPYRIQEVLVRIRTHLALRNAHYLLEERTADLEREIEERERIEDTLRDARDHLEQRVLERTAELSEANRLLEVEIRQRARIEETLRESERFHEGILEALPSILYLYDPRSEKIAFVNDRVYDILGFRADQLNNRPRAFSGLFHPEDREHLHASRQRWGSARDGEFFVSEFRLRHASGSWLWFRARETVFRRDAGGEVSEVLAVALDVTSRKQTEEALWASETRYRTLFDQANDAIFLIDPDTRRFLEVNKTAVRRLGYSREELLQMTVIDIATPAKEALARDAAARIEKEGSIVFESVHLRKDGSEIPVEISSQKVDLGTRAIYQSVARDISERVVAERELLRYQKRLRSLSSELSLTEERERREIANDLHDSVSQDLAAAALELSLLGQSSSEERSIELRARIGDSLDRCLRVVRSLTVELSPPVLYRLGLQAAFGVLAEQIELRHDLSVTLNPAEDLPRLSDDVRGLLYRAVRELLHNVVKHADAGSARVKLRTTEGRLLVEVTDDGDGFDISHTEQRRHMDTCFGLFHLQERIEHLGGDFAIESAIGRGTTVRLTVPVPPDDDAGA